MHILVTGGAGYIGSHTCLELLKAGHQVTVIDNLSNSSEEAINRVEKIAGKPLAFFKADLLDPEALRRIFELCDDVSAVIHFAGLKAVGESVVKPLLYYENNLGSTINLCRAMAEHDVKNIVFSSSATVYGDPSSVPIREDFPLSCTNPYGRTKLFIEEILHDVHAGDPSWNITLLRYFNPIGAHESGAIGEDPTDIPNNLVPYISQVAIGKLEQLSIYGDDYPTHDGTGVRDYIHVVDLAVGHVRAIERIAGNGGVKIYNLGTGRGYSVIDIVKAFAEASGRKINYRITDRRPGDIACCYADPSRAERELGWKAQRGLEEMCRDTWRWQSRNPNGYRP